MSAAKVGSSRFNSVPDDFATAMFAGGSLCMNGTLKTVVIMGDAVDHYFQVLIVFVPTDFAPIHKFCPPTY
jgi:hypothetical protein